MKKVKKRHKMRREKEMRKKNLEKKGKINYMKN